MENQEKRDFTHLLTLYMFFDLLIDPDSDDEAVRNLLHIRKYLKRCNE